MVTMHTPELTWCMGVQVNQQVDFTPSTCWQQQGSAAATNHAMSQVGTADWQSHCNHSFTKQEA
jgi:hypothetical protein